MYVENRVLGGKKHPSGTDEETSSQRYSDLLKISKLHGGRME